ncbi:MAG: hypothetical protein Q7S43_01815 [bacterium]|nr:hypothetical protein [bacterium]
MDNLEKFIKQAKDIHLSKNEKATIRQSVLNFISQNLVRSEAPARLSYGSNIFFFNHFNLTKTMAILLIISLMVGGGVGLAAEQSLPGDSLYQVKIGMNEEVRGWLSVSEEVRANWEVERVQRRLEEAERMASRGSLNAESRAVIEANFEAQSERVRDRIAKFESKDNFNAAIGVSSNFEVALKAHERILAELLDEETDAVLKIEIKPIKIRVGSEASEAKKSREENEDKVSAKVRVDIRSAAEGKLKAAENKIEEVGKFIENMESKLGAEATAQAKARLTLANQTVVEGKTKFESKAYGDAFILFQKAIRIAQEAKLLVQARHELKIDVQINGHRTASDSMEVDSEDEDEDDDNDGEVETKSEMEIDGRSNSNGGSFKGQGKLKIDLGL